MEVELNTEITVHNEVIWTADDSIFYSLSILFFFLQRHLFQLERNKKKSSKQSLRALQENKARQRLSILTMLSLSVAKHNMRGTEDHYHMAFSTLHRLSLFL